MKKQNSNSKTPQSDSAFSKDTPKKRGWYDYPHYYDLGFQDDTLCEARFFEKAFQQYVPGRVRRILEPGCGSGRLILEMAARGYQMTGLDLNETALAYCRSRLERRSLKGRLVRGDMTQFAFKRPFDAAFNTVNTFRHLLTEEAAIQHLTCVANCLNPGGIFILGLHLIPKGSEFFGTERWSARKGKTSITYSLVIIDSNPKTRLEKLRISMTIRQGARKPFRVSDEITMRLYNCRQIKDLLAKVPEFQLLEVFDFWYEIDEPQPLDDRLGDAVFVLQKV